MLDSPVVTSALDQDAPHGQRRGGEEVPASIPLPRLLGHAKVGFVDERRGLECLVRLPLAGQPRSRQLPKFVIDFGNERAGASGAVGIARSGGHKSEPL